MNKMSQFRFLKDTGGSVTAMTAIALIVFVGALAFVIDLGHLHIVQNELRNAADTCALRGARAFVPDNVAGSWIGDPSPDTAKAEAISAVTINKSDNAALKDLPIDDIQVGIWDFKTRQLTPWVWPLPASATGTAVGPAISLPVKRTGSENYGPVGMTLASFLGTDTVSVGARATAAISPWGGPYEGSPVLPFGPSASLVPQVGVPIVGTMKNDGTDNLGWTNLDPAGSHTSAEDIKKIFKNGSLYDTKPTDPVTINNGVAASALMAMTAPNNIFGLEQVPGTNIYQPSTTVTNPAEYANGATYANTVYCMPVFTEITDPDGGKFVHTSLVGAIPIMITEVKTSPDNTITYTRVEGNITMPGHGGGLWFGILSAEPKLVE